MVPVPLVIEIRKMDLDDAAGYPSRLGIPTDALPYVKF
jgi:hypothetical protein